MATAAHKQDDFIPYVVDALNNGHCSNDEIRSHIQSNFPLNREDRARLPSLGCPRWHQTLRNLKSNKTLISKFKHIREVPGGYALRGGRAPVER